MRAPLKQASESGLAARQVTIVILLFAGYACYYFCRSDLSVAMPMLAKELTHAGLSSSAAMVRLGSIASIGVLAYAVGKILLGGLGDVWGGRTSLIGGLAGAVGFTLLFASSGSLPIFTLAWFGNRLVQSIGWAGLVKVCSKWFSYRAYGTIIGILSLSYLLGDALARQWMSALIAHGHGWRSLFYLAAIVSTIVAIANLLFLKESRTALGFSQPEENPLNVFTTENETGNALRSRVTALVTNRGFLLVCVLSLGTTIVRETFNTWTPTYLHDFLAYSNSESAHISAIFPAVGAVSVLLAGLAGDRLGLRGRAIVLVTGMILTAGSLLYLASLHNDAPKALAVLLIGLVAFGLLGPYSYLAGAMALDFGGTQGGATSSGLIDGVGYTGGILAGDTVARLAVHAGWGGVFAALAAVSAASALAAGALFFYQRNRS